MSQTEKFIREIKETGKSKIWGREDSTCYSGCVIPQ